MSRTFNRSSGAMESSGEAVLDAPAEKSISISQEKYIPYQFAESKVAQMAHEIARLKAKYEKHIVLLTEKSNTSIAELKAFYESYIKDMKKKALHHLDIQKKMFEDKEQLGRIQVKTLEDRIDELLDLNAKNRLEFQDRIKLVEKEGQHNTEISMVCEVVLRELCDRIESEQYQAQEEQRKRQFLEKEKVWQTRQLEQACVQKAVNGALLDVLQQVESDYVRQLAYRHETALKIVEVMTSAGREASLTKEFDELKEQLIHAHEENEKQKEMNYQKDMHELQQKLIIAHEESEKKKEAEYQQTIHELQQKYDAEIVGANAHIDRLNAHVSQLQLSIADVYHQNLRAEVYLSMEGLLSQLELRDMKTVREHLKNASSNEHKMHKMLSESAHEVATLQAQLDQSQKSYSSLLVERDAGKQKLEQLTQEIDRLSKEVEHLQATKSASASGTGAQQESFEYSGVRTLNLVPNASDPVPLHLRLKLQALQDKLEDDTKKEVLIAQAKNRSKDELKQWLKEFEDTHGRAPANEDKEAIKDKFESQKRLSSELKELQTAMDVTLNEIELLKKKISDIEDRKADAQHAGKRRSVIVVEGSAPISDPEPSVIPSGGISEEELTAIRNEWEIEKERELHDLKTEMASISMQRDQIQLLLNNVMSETRADVIKRLEEEIAAHQASVSSLTEAAISAKSERAKLQSRLDELQDRAERAERELVENDKRYTKDLSESEEKRLLAEQIAKQREDIILKSKAATSGWDAAAHAEEMLDIEVDRAYQNGLKEGKSIVEGDVALLHKSVEEKERKNLELLEINARLGSAIKEAELKVEAAEKNAALAIRQAQATGGGGGGGAVNDEVLEELRQAREALDNTQEECILTSEQLAAAHQEIAIYKEQIVIYQNMLAASRLGASAPVLSVASASPHKVRDPALVKQAEIRLSEIVERIRQAIVEGSQLWKDGKRDECYELYASLGRRICNEVKTPFMVDPLTEAGKSAEAVPKSKGAVVLRKAFDKIMNDLSDNGPEYAAEVEAQAGGSSSLSAPAATPVVAISGGDSAEMKQLQARLSALDKKRAILETNAASERPAESGISASLLKRAKEAEEKVEDLRQQLADAKLTSGNRGGRGGAAGGGGADPAEIRRLQKRIKELEASGGGGGGSGGGAADKKAAAAAEKNFQKKMKEMETANRKEKSALEARAVAAEKELADTQDKLAATSQEREKLKIRVGELSNMSAEMEALRQRAAQADEFSSIIYENNVEITRLTEQYKKESALRKKYKNELEDLKGAIRVYARCRPMARYELEKNCQQVVRFVDETALKVQTSRGEKEFEFDAAFTYNSTQEEVFEDTKRLVESFLDGFNVCLFAYGQTGSGKTFTMTGSPSMPGLTPRAIDELFRLIGERKHWNCRVTTYFVELYNDNLVDLYWVLDNKKNRSLEPPKLDIKVDAKKMVYIKNATIKDAHSPEELMDLFNKGNKERHTGSTNMNAESSRSHSIFAIMVESFDTTTKKTTIGKLSLVDLAGSERADKTGASAERLKEAQNINKSLSALGDVISALSEGEKFIPYRNNKLTQLMQDSLGGNAKTLMFVNFSPADYNSDETVTSLNYAARVKKITNNASKQAESEEVARLKSIIKKLQAGIAVDNSELAPGGDEGQPDAAALEAFELNRKRREEEDGITFGEPMSGIEEKENA